MKYHVFITKKEILTGILFIAGLLFLFHGVHSAYKCNQALDLNDLYFGKQQILKRTAGGF